MTVWMYFTTDGDAGYYRIALFTSRAKAEAWMKACRERDGAYGRVEEIAVK